MTNVTGKRVALIGGAGFIGHNLALQLKSEGMEVHIIDSLQVNNVISFFSTGSEVYNRDLYLSFLEQRFDLLRSASVPVHIQDARDYHQLSRILTGIKPDYIVLLAAVAHADRANKDPYSTFDHSLRSLENALDWSRGSNLQRFIYFSSSMVYGNFVSGEVNEETPCNPMGIYGALKFAGEKMVIAYNQVFSLPYTIVRPSALYGERCVSRRVSQIFIENVMQGLEVSVKGDGSDRLDFTYIRDLCQGVSKIIRNESAKNEIFNITYGESRSIAELADILLANFPEVKVNYLPRDKMMPERGTLSVEKARRLIGYEPSFPLEKGYAAYIHWYREMIETFHSKRRSKKAA